MAKDTILAIAVPCYNKGKIIKYTIERLKDILSDLLKKEKISDLSYIYLIDDNSNDDCWYEIGKCVARFSNLVKASKFSSNFGKQQALLGCVLGAKKIGCSVVITLDADLRQDENKIEEFIDKFDKGAKIVFGIDSFKKYTDYRLASYEVLEIIEKNKKADLSLKKLLKKIDLKKDVVYFNYKFKKLKFDFNFLNIFKTNNKAEYIIDEEFI